MFKELFILESDLSDKKLWEIINDIASLYDSPVKSKSSKRGVTYYYDDPDTAETNVDMSKDGDFWNDYKKGTRNKLSNGYSVTLESPAGTIKVSLQYSVTKDGKMSYMTASVQ